MKKILAVSGGVDSVVLFDMFTKGNDETTSEEEIERGNEVTSEEGIGIGNGGGEVFDRDEVVVAHFDHGARASSGTDAEFVRQMCREAGVECVVERAELGEGVSESLAREARYAFLGRVASELGGKIYTAHHVDDVTESVAINILRGTGWRGLCPMGNRAVRRPLVEMGWGRKEILRYAGERGLHFRQDPTNYEDGYLRNRVRRRFLELEDESEKLIGLWKRQGEIREEIEILVQGLLPEKGIYQRKWFRELPDEVAMEILRAGLLKSGTRVTRPQLVNFLEAVRKYASGKQFNLPEGRMVRMEKTYFKL